VEDVDSDAEAETFGERDCVRVSVLVVAVCENEFERVIDTT
jgi:hypothetical protein